jgi:hypothetical protein
MPDHCVSNFLDMSMRAGALGYHRINVGYSRIDVARSQIVRTFLEAGDDPDDTLVMMDMDHIHPRDTIERLADHEHDVVAALAFRRCPPYDPQMYKIHEDGTLVQASSWDTGLVEVDAFGMAAFATKRRVYRKLEEAGANFPYFRFWYPRVPMEQQGYPSEDIFFCMCLKAAGIPMLVDTGLVSPHLTMSTVDDNTWFEYLADNPAMVEGRVTAMPPGLAEKVGVKVTPAGVEGE